MDRNAVGPPCKQRASEPRWLEGWRASVLQRLSCHNDDFPVLRLHERRRQGSRQTPRLAGVSCHPVSFGKPGSQVSDRNAGLPRPSGIPQQDQRPGQCRLLHRLRWTGACGSELRGPGGRIQQDAPVFDYSAGTPLYINSRGRRVGRRIGLGGHRRAGHARPLQNPLGR